MPLSDEYDSDFVAEGSDVDDDIAEIVSSAPPERDEAIDLCEDIDAREEDVIDLLNDDKDVPPVATFKQMFEDIVKHVHTFVEERIEQAIWGGEQYRVVPPAVDSEIGQVLKTLQLLDPTLQDRVDPKDKASKLHCMPYVEAIHQPFTAEHRPSKIMKDTARKGKLADGTSTAAPAAKAAEAAEEAWAAGATEDEAEALQYQHRPDGEPHSVAPLRACRQAAQAAFQEAQDGRDYICGGETLPKDHPYYKGQVTVQFGWVMEDCLHHMETFSILNAGPLLEEARVKAIMTEKELRVPRRWTRSLGRGGLNTPRGAKARRPGQRGAKARRPGQRGAKARRPGQRGAKARRPGQRGAKARRPGQRGAKARRPGQRGAKARRPGQRGAKARRPGQRGAKARRPGQRGAKARRPGQRGAKARRPGQRGAKTAHTAESAERDALQAVDGSR
eukprot:jgi/Tetstr1/464713/TSEL_009460.t1